jgi:hypothetical protein
MKNYLICNIQDVIDIDGNVLGKRVCDVSDNTFPVSNDYEWKQYAEYLDIYNNEWYWADDKPVEYIPPPPKPAPKDEQPSSSGVQDL